MRQVVTILILLIACCVKGQSSRSELTHSNIYYRATYIESVNKIIGLQIRTDLKDTLIDNIRFQKFLSEDFTDYSQKTEKVFITKHTKRIFIPCLTVPEPNYSSEL